MSAAVSETRESIEARLAAARSGEDPDLSGLLAALWEDLYAQIPRLTRSKDKDVQHRLLAERLVELGLPRSPDLQYVAGPVLWFAREKGVLPPARGADEPWTLDAARFEAGRRSRDEGLTAYGDWMRDALRTLLAEQA
jgi:hypothetical protein